MTKRKDPENLNPRQRAEAQSAASAQFSTPAIKTAPRGNRKVTVASKLPMDLILQLCKKEHVRTTGQYGSTTEEVYIPHGPTVMIRGTAYPNGIVPKGFPKPPHLIEDAGYALTSNVDADFWETWLDQNRTTAMVVNGMIKAHASLVDLESDAMDFAKVKSGLDALEPDTDPRNPKPITTAIAKVQKADVVAA